MAIQTAPSFEALEKLRDTRDADLISRPMLDPARNRGRGAQTNISSRFDKESRDNQEAAAVAGSTCLRK